MRIGIAMANALILATMTTASAGSISPPLPTPPRTLQEPPVQLKRFYYCNAIGAVVSALAAQPAFDVPPNNYVIDRVYVQPRDVLNRQNGHGHCMLHCAGHVSFPECSGRTD